MNQKTLDEIRKIVNKYKWKFAKSMPNTPHWYIVRTEINNEHDYKAIYDFIKENGYKKKFFSKTYTYCDIDEYSYWYMTDNFDESIIINRCRKVQ